MRTTYETAPIAVESVTMNGGAVTEEKPMPMGKRHASYEDLTEDQKTFYDMLDAAGQEMFLSVLPEKRQSGASRKEKMAVLEKRLALTKPLFEAVESYQNRLAHLLARLASGDIKAGDIDLRLHNLPAVEGVVLRFEGKKRGPRAEKGVKVAA